VDHFFGSSTWPRFLLTRFPIVFLRGQHPPMPVQGQDCFTGRENQENQRNPAPNCTACSSVVKRMNPRLAGLPLPDNPPPPKGSVEGEKVAARFA
jgi:hypothetical protein